MNCTFASMFAPLLQCFTWLLIIRPVKSIVTIGVSTLFIPPALDSISKRYLSHGAPQSTILELRQFNLESLPLRRITYTLLLCYINSITFFSLWVAIKQRKVAVFCSPDHRSQSSSPKQWRCLLYHVVFTIIIFQEHLAKPFSIKPLNKQWQVDKIRSNPPPIPNRPIKFLFPSGHRSAVFRRFRVENTFFFTTLRQAASSHCNLVWQGNWIWTWEGGWGGGM